MAHTIHWSDPELTLCPTPPRSAAQDAHRAQEPVSLLWGEV